MTSWHQIKGLDSSKGSSGQYCTPGTKSLQPFRQKILHFYLQMFFPAFGTVSTSVLCEE